MSQAQEQTRPRIERELKERDSGIIDILEAREQHLAREFERLKDLLEGLEGIPIQTQEQQPQKQKQAQTEQQIRH